MMDGLTARLAQLAAQGQTTTYGALARDLAIPGPGAIARLAAALEQLMEADAADGLALRAALVTGRLAGDLPAPGFFLKAAELGLTIGDPADFVARQRAALFSAR